MTAYTSSSGKSKGQEKSAVVELFEFAVGIAGAIAVIYFLVGMALDIIIDKMPVEFEEAMVSLIDEEDYESPYYFVEAEIAAQEILNKMAARAFKDKSFKVHIANNPDMSAYILPGGNVVLNAGLVKELSSENQLVFIMAHMLGHYKSRDYLKVTGRHGVFAFLSVSLFGAESGITDAFTSSLDFNEQSFTRQQEAKADEFAVNMMHQLYGHVGGAVDFLKHIASKQGTLKFDDFNDTHPMDDTRISTVQSYIRSSSYTEGQQYELNPIVFRTYLFDK